MGVPIPEKLPPVNMSIIKNIDDSCLYKERIKLHNRNRTFST